MENPVRTCCAWLSSLRSQPRLLDNEVLWRSIVCVIAIPYHEVGIFRPRHFSQFFTRHLRFFFFFFFFGGQDFWHSDNSYVGFLDPLLATKSQNLTTICYNIDFRWPPRLMNQVVRPYFMPWKFQRVLRCFKSNGANMQRHATFFFCALLFV